MSLPYFLAACIGTGIVVQFTLDAVSAIVASFFQIADEV